jgi:LPS-assembly lipoprotein
MSSSEPHPRPRAGRRLLLLAALPALLLAACTVQPLYGTAPSGEAVASALSHVAIDQVDNRVAQEVRNRLIFLLYGGAGQPTAPAYKVRLTVATTESALGVTPIESAPAYSVTVAATYEVTSLATGEIVLRTTSRGSASYDRVNQVFANTRARLDAENRAAVVVADDIRTRLAAALSRGVI